MGRGSKRDGLNASLRGCVCESYSIQIPKSTQSTECVVSSHVSVPCACKPVCGDPSSSTAQLLLGTDTSVCCDHPKTGTKSFSVSEAFLPFKQDNVEIFPCAVFCLMRKTRIVKCFSRVTFCFYLKESTALTESSL